MDLGLMAIVFSESTLPVQTMSLNSDANTERRRRRFGVITIRPIIRSAYD